MITARATAAYVSSERHGVFFTVLAAGVRPSDGRKLVTYPCRGAVVAALYAQILGKLALLVIASPQLRLRFLDASFLGASYLAT
jgi:hypothetical protein